MRCLNQELNAEVAKTQRSLRKAIKSIVTSVSQRVQWQVRTICLGFFAYSASLRILRF